MPLADFYVLIKVSDQLIPGLQPSLPRHQPA